MNLLARTSVFCLGMAFFSAGTATQGLAADPEFGAANQARQAFFENETKSDSGIRGPSYATIVAELDALTIAHPEWVDRFQYGTSPKGRPLVALRISKKSRPASPHSRPAVLIAGTIHGNEYLNIEDRLPRWFLETGMKNAEIRSYFDAGGVAILAPILNPDGYETRNRENSAGVDLNRDFTVRRKNHFGFKQTETKTLSEFVADQVKDLNLRLAVTMDYHCCIGALLHPWSFKAPTPPRVDLERFAEVGSIFGSVFGRGYKFGTTPKILGYSAVGTSKDYYYETYGAVALTFEGKKKQEDKKFAEHTQMWKKIIASINAGRL